MCPTQHAGSQSPIDAAYRGALIETAEVVGLVPGPPVRMTLNDGRSLSADAVVLATGRPKGGMPDSLERAFAPSGRERAREVVVRDCRRVVAHDQYAAVGQ